ncbi:Cyclic pyranopterin monophosphate synthase [Synechococcus sp. MIT S9509]|nr:Cyclic pyranopterin monophosphate synthase [Synechococcus sp. MIT S9504]KZR91809.1 Cyclic pyranopterin monophosphate synthase [Synechococcus sp. MIT S9509]
MLKLCCTAEPYIACFPEGCSTSLGSIRKLTQWFVNDDQLIFCDVGAAGIGVIASISEPFCGDGNRLRITADGQAFICLFTSRGTDLKPALTSDAELEPTISSLWQQRLDQYSEEGRAASGSADHAEMADLGG